VAERVLIVDDEERIRKLLVMYLEKEGYIVDEASNGNDGLERLKYMDYSCVLLDVQLPMLNGKSILSELRKTKATPVIIMSAQADEQSRVEGFELGADDYVTKPFSNRELQARVKALLRRTDLVSVDSQESDEKKAQPLQIGDLEIVPDAYVAKKYGEELDLTHREFELLYHLASHIGQVITREHLLETVWGYDYFGDVRTVDVTIRRLREKIEDTPSRPEYILTRRGVGYYMRNND